MTATFKRLRGGEDLPAPQSAADQMGLDASLLEVADPPSSRCGGRAWQWVRHNGYRRTVAGLGFLTTSIATIVFKVLNYRQWNDQPVACTALATTMGASVHGTVECLSKLDTRRWIRQIYKDYSLPAFWWISQFFIITTAATDWHEGFKVTILYAGGTYLANKVFEALDKSTAGADALSDSQFARTGSRSVIFTRKGALVIESAKMGIGGGLIAASFFTSIPYPEFCLYSGSFFLFSPVGIAARLGFRMLVQHRENVWIKKRLDIDEPAPCDVKTLRITGKVMNDWWTTFMGAGIAAGSLVTLPPTSVACLWATNGVLFFGASEADLDEFEDIPIPGPNPYSESAQNVQWYIHRGLALGGGVYVIALMATNPWPNQLVLSGYVLGAFGKHLLIRYAEKDYDPENSSPYQRYVRFNTHHRTLIFTLPFYFIESHMGTGNHAIVKYYDEGDWAKISAATLSWASYGATFISPIPGPILPPAVLSELVRFTVKAAGGAV